MSCRMKGGSVASDAVVKTVSDAAFAKLNAQFTNQVGGKTRPRKPTRPAKPAKPTKPTKSRKGGMCMICGGSKQQDMKHFNDFDNAGLMRVHNKKGGSNNPSFDIRYDYGTSMTQSAHGPLVNRALNFEAANMMSSESVTPLGAFNKVPAYGNMSDVSDGKFIYGGARRRKATKSTKKTSRTTKPTRK